MQRYHTQPPQLNHRPTQSGCITRLFKVGGYLFLAGFLLFLSGSALATSYLVINRAVGLTASQSNTNWTTLPTLTRTPLPTLTPTPAVVQSNGAETPAVAPVMAPPTAAPVQATTQIVRAPVHPAATVALASMPPTETATPQAIAVGPTPTTVIMVVDEPVTPEPTMEALPDDIDDEIYVRNIGPTATRPPTRTPPPYNPTATRIPFVVIDDVLTVTPLTGNPAATSVPTTQRPTSTPWASPTPLPTRTPHPAATATPTDNNWTFASVRVDGDKVYGLLTNTSDSTRDLWFISAGSRSFYSDWPIDYVDAGDSIPFVISAGGEPANLEAMSKPVNGIQHRSFEVSDLAEQPDGDTFCVTGSIQESLDELEEYLIIGLILYDENNNVLNFDTYDAFDLDPEEDSGNLPVLLCVDAKGASISGYNLRVWGM